MTTNSYREYESYTAGSGVTVRSLDSGEFIRTESARDPRQRALDEAREAKGMGRELVERNDAVIRMYAEDPNITKIARTFGVHRTRVKQILDREGLRKTKEEGSIGQYNPKRWSESVLRGDPNHPHAPVIGGEA